MAEQDSRRIETDLLIVGSGFAGLWAAISAREAGVPRVAIVDKASIAMSSQSRHCAGATIYCLPEDDPDAWLRDMVEAQSFLSRQPMIEQIIQSSYERLRKLEEWGVRYPQSPDGQGYLRLPSRGLQQMKMMVIPRFRGRIGGAALADALRRRAVRMGIGRHPRIMITDLLRQNGRVAGAIGFDRSHAEAIVFAARAVLLATADCSFRGHYVCTDATTGDGFRLAYDQGVRLSNMEFLVTNTGSARFGFEGTGVALKWGGRLLNARGEEFMQRHHPEGNAAEIDALTQSMAREAKRGNGPPFFIELGDSWKERARPALSAIGGFMSLNIRRLEKQGIDLAERQEWIPAIQTLRGGIRTGRDGQSDLPGLFAAGTAEALDPGLFNGWSTMRAMGSGQRSGCGAAAYLRDADPVCPESDEIRRLVARARAPLESRDGAAGPDVEDVIERMQKLIFRPEVSLCKSEHHLEDALREIGDLRDNALPQLRAADAHGLAKIHEAGNMIQVAEMFLRASLARTESRGAHCREDHPECDNRKWLRWINLYKSGESDSGGSMALQTEPVPLEHYPIQPREEPRVRGSSTS